MGNIEVFARQDLGQRLFYQVVCERSQVCGLVQENKRKEVNFRWPFQSNIKVYWQLNMWIG
jgi:hypothetical protein